MSSVQSGITTENASSTLDSHPYIDTKNGFSITPPKGWTMDNSGAHKSVVNFINGQSVIDVAMGTTTGSLDVFSNIFIDSLQMTLPKYSLLDDTRIDLRYYPRTQNQLQLPHDSRRYARNDTHHGK